MSQIKIDKFRRFGFTHTSYITGGFDNLSIADKKLIKDSNFKFKTDKFSIKTLDDMFNGCENATFSHSLCIGSDNTVKSAKRMFKDCSHARIPNVYISNSNLTDCESMFEGCTNARLKNIDFPKNVVNVKKMFKNCKTATFDTIGTMKNTIKDYTETFYGCTNGTFGKIFMQEPKSSDEFNFSYMFYGCINLDSDNLYFENISEYAHTTDYMFYGAGNKESETFDDSVLNFGKLQSCTSMFDSSNFAFDGTYVQFYRNGSVHGYLAKTNVKSIAKMFYNTTCVRSKAPTVVLGGYDIYTVSEMEKVLTGAVKGHYQINGNALISGITDFSNCFAYSNLKEADLRGISNNTELNDLVSTNGIGIQNFTSMYEDCTKLEKTYGYIPSCGYTYDGMFRGCSSYTADVSELFKAQPIAWDGDQNKLIREGIDGNSFLSYCMTSINGMFDGCNGLKSTHDDFDLVGLVKTVSETLTANGYQWNRCESFNGAFPKMIVASKNPHSELSFTNYDIDGISENHEIVRYCSFIDDPYDVSDGEPYKYGLYSSIARNVFSNGFYRFGGYFKEHPTMFYCTIEHPLKEYETENTNGFYIQTMEYTPLMVPHDFTKKYNMDKSVGYWNEYRFEKLYAAKIYDATSGKFVKNAFVGPYTRIYSEMRYIDGIETTVTKSIRMPVTYFDSYLGADTVEEL